MGLVFLQGQFATDYPTLMAGALLSMLTLFAVTQEYFVADLACSGLKQRGARYQGSHRGLLSHSGSESRVGMAWR